MPETAAVVRLASDTFIGVQEVIAQGSRHEYRQIFSYPRIFSGYFLLFFGGIFYDVFHRSSVCFCLWLG